MCCGFVKSETESSLSCFSPVKSFVSNPTDVGFANRSGIPDQEAEGFDTKGEMKPNIKISSQTTLDNWLTARQVRVEPPSREAD